MYFSRCALEFKLDWVIYRRHVEYVQYDTIQIKEDEGFSYLVERISAEPILGSPQLESFGVEPIRIAMTCPNWLLLKIPPNGGFIWCYMVL
jgi:hypothetical protein